MEITSQKSMPFDESTEYVESSNAVVATASQINLLIKMKCAETEISICQNARPKIQEMISTYLVVKSPSTGGALAIRVNNFLAKNLWSPYVWKCTNQIALGTFRECAKNDM